jgi:uncharacterized integral membrane protein (TIGR00697 family)
MRAVRWCTIGLAVFVTAFIVSNIIAVKLISILGFTLPAAVILFPVANIFGDVLTEVSGHSRARQAIWTGFGCILLAVIAIGLSGILPADSHWNAGTYIKLDEASQAYQAHPRLFAASPYSFIHHIFSW